MKLILSKILYYLGDLISKFLYFNCFSWLYKYYAKIMLLSSKLDKDGKIWKDDIQKVNKKISKVVKKSKLHE